VSQRHLDEANELLLNNSDKTTVTKQHEETSKCLIAFRQVQGCNRAEDAGIEDRYEREVA
jgi:hypothetical protein